MYYLYNNIFYKWKIGCVWKVILKLLTNIVRRLVWMWVSIVFKTCLVWKIGGSRWLSSQWLLLCWYFLLVRIIKNFRYKKKRRLKIKDKRSLKTYFIWNNWLRMLAELLVCTIYCVTFQNSIRKLLKKILYYTNLSMKIRARHQMRLDKVS